MSQRLSIGLSDPSPLLISLLNSIGVWYEKVDITKDLSRTYSLLIIGNTKPDQTTEHQIRNYLATGGALLEISTDPIYYPSLVTKRYSHSISNEKSGTEFDRISHIDIYSRWSYSDSSIFSGLVDFKVTKNGTLGFVGLNLTDLPKDSDYTRKRFLSPFGRQPDEIVNKLSRDSLADLIELSVQRMFHIHKLPFIKKWISPEPKPVFGFRIDTDFGTKESIEPIYKLLDNHSLNGTWFLHVQAHENWLKWFKDLNDQELALHGYKHGYSSSFSKVRSNIEQGLKTLVKNDIQPKGFCAPYGIWNNALRKSLEDFEFEYTSEFTSGYDALPFTNQYSDNIQVPVHPICTGSLNRRQYSFEDMKSYFCHIYDQKKALHKPVIFYHHPLQNGLELFDEIFTKANSDGMTNLTFLEYARFWRSRSQHKFSAVLSNRGIEIDSNDSSLLFFISKTPNEFALISSESQLVSLDLNPSFKYNSPSLPSVQELEKMQRDRLQILKTSFIDWRNRYRL